MIQFIIFFFVTDRYYRRNMDSYSRTMTTRMLWGVFWEGNKGTQVSGHEIKAILKGSKEKKSGTQGMKRVLSRHRSTVLLTKGIDKSRVLRLPERWRIRVSGWNLWSSWLKFRRNKMMNTLSYRAKMGLLSPLLSNEYQMNISLVIRGISSWCLLH